MFLICGRLREVESYEKRSYLKFQLKSNVKNEGKRGAFCGRSTLRPTPLIQPDVTKVDLSFKTGTKVSA